MSEMARKPGENQPFNIMIVGQSGRLQYEALLFVASLRQNSPQFRGRMIVVEPQAGPKWAKDPTMSADVKNALLELGAEIAPFETVHFGDSYLTAIRSKVWRQCPRANRLCFSIPIP